MKSERGREKERARNISSERFRIFLEELQLTKSQVLHTDGATNRRMRRCGRRRQGWNVWSLGWDERYIARLGSPQNPRLLLRPSPRHCPTSNILRAGFPGCCIAKFPLLRRRHTSETDGLGLQPLLTRIAKSSTEDSCKTRPLASLLSCAGVHWVTGTRPPPLSRAHTTLSAHYSPYALSPLIVFFSSFPFARRGKIHF